MSSFFNSVKFIFEITKIPKKKNQQLILSKEIMTHNFFKSKLKSDETLVAKAPPSLSFCQSTTHAGIGVHGPPKVIGVGTPEVSLVDL